MSCLLTLAANTLCLVSFSDLTLRADASTQIAGDVRHWSGSRNYGGALIGRVELSMPLVSYRGFSIQTGIRHESLLNTRGDRGEERLTFGFVYRPFGGAR